MENKGTSKNIIIVILLVLLIGLFLYVGYDKLLNNKGSEKEESKDTTIENKTNTDEDIKAFYENMVKNRKVTWQHSDNNKIEFLLDKDGNVYYSEDNVKNAVGEKGKYKIEGFEGAFNDGTNVVDEFDGYKLSITNVIAMYQYYVGNDRSVECIFIKADGTIARLTYYLSFQNNERTAYIQKYEESVPNYKNIVSVEQKDEFGTGGYCLIDINGNIYNNTF